MEPRTKMQQQDMFRQQKLPIGQLHAPAGLSRGDKKMQQKKGYLVAGFTNLMLTEPWQTHRRHSQVDLESGSLVDKNVN